MNRALTIFAILCLLITAGITLGVRIAGPGDLYEKDQPKTIAYTADVVLHGRYALPRDVLYQPATKPPLYNWISAIVVKATGSWDEWALKFPSLLGSVVCGAVVFGMTRRALRPAPLHTDACGVRSEPAGLGVEMPSTGPSDPWRDWVVPALAASIWFTFGSDVRHASVLRLSYLARPDMLQCAFLTLAWLAATITIDRATPRKAFWFAMLFWLCIAGAALTKGPAAIMVVVYAVAYAVCRAFMAMTTVTDASPFQRITSALKRLWIPVGLPLVIACVGGWLWAAYAQDPMHVRETIIGAEMVGRVAEESPEGFTKPVYYSAMWFVTKALPWGGLALVALLWWLINPRSRSSLLAPALWLVIVLLLLSIPAGKRMDYLIPAYAPASVLCAVMLAGSMRDHRMREPRGSAARSDDLSVESTSSGGRVPWPHGLRVMWMLLVSLVPVAIASALAYLHLNRFHESISHDTDRTITFVRTVRDIVKDDPLLVIVRGKHPIPTLLGRHQRDYLTPADIAASRWVILPEPPGIAPAATSEPVPVGFETIDARERLRLGLYPTAAFKADNYQTLIDLQKRVGEWTRTENPYHRPGTVYRDAANPEP